eukprot:7041787-Pyramimonas_sp.AAC.1
MHPERFQENCKRNVSQRKSKTVLFLATYVMLDMWSNRCRAIYVAQMCCATCVELDVVCNMCGTTFVEQCGATYVCNICGAMYVVKSMWCSMRCAMYVVE